MQDKTIVYVRNRKNTPIGVTYFQRTNVHVGDKEVITMGWSKACKCDTFTKKQGKTIATKRAEKATKWVANAADNIDIVTSEDIRSIDAIPFVIKENISYYFNTAKENLGIDGDAIIVVPVVEKFVDIADALKDAIATDSGFVDPSKSKSTTQTRYITLQH